MDEACKPHQNGVVATSPAEFRAALAHFATGVTIVTAFDSDGHPAGLTANAFASVSLEPPLVLVCVHHKSQAYPALYDAGSFGINVLAANQEMLSRRFSTSRFPADGLLGDTRFDGVPYRCGERLDVPLIEGTLAQLECATRRLHIEGDHTIFVGRVACVHIRAGRPLLYYRGHYRRLGENSER